MRTRIERPAAWMVDALRNSTLFHGVPVRTVSLIAGSASLVKLARGEQLPALSGRTPGVHIVVSGSLMLTVGDPHSGKVMELANPGDSLNLAATVLNAEETVSAEALSECALLRIPRSVLLECAAATPSLALQLAKALGNQVQDLIADIEGYSLHTGRKRVADYLLRLASSHGEQPPVFSLPAKKSVIASRLSLTPEYFSRTLHELIVAGAIAVSGRQITLLDTNRLS